MSDLYLDPGTGDLSVSSAGVVRLTEGTLETVAQRLKIKLRTFLGEWFLNTQIGIPYYQSILGIKNPDFAPIRSIFRNALLADPDVESVPTLQISLGADRTLVVIIDVYAIDRDLELITPGNNPILVPVASESDPLILFF